MTLRFRRREESNMIVSELSQRDPMLLSDTELKDAIDVVGEELKKEVTPKRQRRFDVLWGERVRRLNEEEE